MTFKMDHKKNVKVTRNSISPFKTVLPIWGPEINANKVDCVIAEF